MYFVCEWTASRLHVFANEDGISIMSGGQLSCTSVFAMTMCSEITPVTSKVKRSRPACVCVCRNLLASYIHSVYLIHVSAPAGRYVTLPIATASAAAAAVVFTMTLTACRQQSQLRQALTSTSLAPVTLTSHGQRHVLPNHLLTFCTETQAFGS